ANVPAGSALLTENWDDQLPLPLPGEQPYAIDRAELYDVDSSDKITKLVDQLTSSDYLIIASNRLTDSIPRIPEKYPATIAYYQMLFSGDLGYRLVQTFSSRPTILGISLHDDNAEESFTVADHPKVMIFQKTGAFDANAVSTRLNAILASTD